MIGRVYINNFNGLQNFVLDLAGRPFVLASGSAGSGKSAFCRALAFLRDLAIGSGALSDVARCSVSLLPAGGLLTTFGISFLEAGHNYIYQLSFSFDRGRGEFLVDKEYVNADNALCANREENVATVWGNGVAPVTFALDRRTLLLSTASGIRGDDPLFVVKRYLSRILSLAPVAELMNVDSVMPESWMLQGNGVNLPNWYAWANRANAGFKGLVDGYVKRYVEDAVCVEVVNDVNGMMMLVLRRLNSASQFYDVPLSALSSSEKVSLFFAVLMAFRTVWPNNVVVVDDVLSAVQQNVRVKIAEDLHNVTGVGKQVVLFSSDSEVNRALFDSSKFRFVRSRSPEFVK